MVAGFAHDRRHAGRNWGFWGLAASTLLLSGSPQYRPFSEANCLYTEFWRHVCHICIAVCAQKCLSIVSHRKFCSHSRSFHILPTLLGLSISVLPIQRQHQAIHQSVADAWGKAAACMHGMSITGVGAPSLRISAEAESMLSSFCFSTARRQVGSPSTHWITFSFGGNQTNR